jgi:hypothetical protein
VKSKLDTFSKAKIGTTWLKFARGSLCSLELHAILNLGFSNQVGSNSASGFHGFCSFAVSLKHPDGESHLYYYYYYDNSYY